MLKNLKLGSKLLLAFLAVGVIPFAVVGAVSWWKAQGSLSQAAYGQLESVREIKKNQIERFFRERQGDVGVLMETVASLRSEAFSKLESIQEIKKAQVEGYFRERYGDAEVLSANNTVRRALTEFSRAFDAAGGRPEGMAYEVAEKEFGAFLTKYQKSYGYYDLFLVSPAGEVVYSVEKESDLGQSLRSGPLADSGLARAWAGALEQGRPVIADFAPYAPSGGEQAAFLAAPVGQAGETLGVVALQLPTGPINTMVQRRDGMGRTGETYLVGRREGRTAFRSDLQTMGDGEYVIGRRISTPYIEAALAGKEAQEVHTDSAGKLVMVAYDPLEIRGLNWAMVSKIDLEEAIAPKQEGAEQDYYARYIEQYGYYDLFLISPEGQVFYTVTREADYDTNMVDGKYADSNLGQLVRQVLRDKGYGLADFAPYAPSNGAPASFIAQPFVRGGEVEVVVALQLSLKAINNIMQERAGMGQSGETYLVGPDLLMRSDSYLDPENHSVKASFANPAQGKVDTKAARQALAGRSGQEIITDYNGNQVLSAYAPVELEGVTWALLAEIDESEAFAAVHAMEWLIAMVAVIGIAAIVTVALLVGRSISRPINRVVKGLNSGAEQVAAASSQVSSASQSLAQGASEQAASLEETSGSMEEMASMTKRNAESAKQADGLMQEAAQVVDKAGNSMGDLKEAMDRITSASDEMAKIIKTIDEIAFQTNLLALNAAVEAARAGEAGAGFAVVADEVRNLAMRAAEAAKNTSELIEGNITNIRQGSKLVQATDHDFSQVAESAQKVGGLVAEIAQASSEQAQGIEQINTATGEMDKVTQQVAANAEESAASSEELNAQAETMQSMVAELAALVEGAKATAGAAGRLEQGRRRLLPQAGEEEPEPEQG
jgi:methyl-accepting chemotaxis protein